MTYDDETDRARKATQYLIDTAFNIAQAKANLIRKEKSLSRVKALAMKYSGENSAAAQEREAYASSEYLDAIEELATATLEYEKLRAARDSAKMQIEYWRSLNANQRQAERGYGSAA